MQDDDIDLERTITDPAYRRRVVESLNAKARGEDEGRDMEAGAASRDAGRPSRDPA